MLAGLAAPAIWRARSEPGAKFLLAWIVPAWIVLELVATKLPHYVLPLYPAIAILIAGVIDNHALSRHRWLERGPVWWFVITAAVGLATDRAQRRSIGQQPGLLAWPFLVAALHPRAVRLVALSGRRRRAALVRAAAGLDPALVGAVRLDLPGDRRSSFRRNDLSKYVRFTDLRRSAGRSPPAITSRAWCSSDRHRPQAHERRGARPSSSTAAAAASPSSRAARSAPSRSAPTRSACATPGHAGRRHQHQRRAADLHHGPTARRAARDGAPAIRTHRPMSALADLLRRRRRRPATRSRCCAGRRSPAAAPRRAAALYRVVAILAVLVVAASMVLVDAPIMRLVDAAAERRGRAVQRDHRFRPRRLAAGAARRPAAGDAVPAPRRGCDL